MQTYEDELDSVALSKEIDSTIEKLRADLNIKNGEPFGYLTTVIYLALPIAYGISAW